MASRNIWKLGALDAKHTAFLLCDIQETFRPHVKHFGEMVKVANKMHMARPSPFLFFWEDDIKKVAGITWRQNTLDRNIWKSLEEAYVEGRAGDIEAAKHFKIPVYVSEQYPKGLGHTTKDITLDSAALVYEKTSFSMLTPELEAKMKSDVPDLKSVVLFGLETHVCIEQTVIDLLNKDVSVHVLADGVSSRSLMDRGLALQRFLNVGCMVGTSENVLFKLLRDKNHPAFKAISKLNVAPTPDEFGQTTLQSKVN